MIEFYDLGVFWPKTIIVTDPSYKVGMRCQDIIDVKPGMWQGMSINKGPEDNLQTVALCAYYVDKNNTNEYPYLDINYRDRSGIDFPNNLTAMIGNNQLAVDSGAIGIFDHRMYPLGGCVGEQWYPAIHYHTGIGLGWGCVAPSAPTDVFYDHWHLVNAEDEVVGIIVEFISPSWIGPEDYELPEIPS